MAAPTPSSGAKSSGVIPAEWPAQAADTIVVTIDKVRDRTTNQVIKGARAVVYGIIVAVIGSIAAFLFLLLATRFVDNYLPGGVWVTDTLFAVVFVVAGMVLLRQASKPVPTDTL